MTVAKIVRLFRDKRAVDAVIANLILIGAVIVVGFAALFWAQYQSYTYNQQYSDIIGSDINQTQERIVFENIVYDKTKNNMTVYLMNSGTIGNVNITTIYVNNKPNSTIALKFLNGASSNALNVGQEGYFSIAPYPSLSVGTSYSIKIKTGRESTFVGTFVA